MKSRRLVLAIFCFCAVGINAQEIDDVRIKDIAQIQGIRENQLTGIGLVTGLEGKGDSSNSTLLQSVLASLLSSFQIAVPSSQIRSKNCAVVMVTADVSSFARPGDRVNVQVASIGDAKSIRGGVLLQTNLQAANRQVYAVAQGALSTGAQESGALTVSTLSGGAIVEREILSDFINNNQVSIILKNPDFKTATLIGAELSAKYPETEAGVIDASLIQVQVPDEYTDNPVSFLAEIEDLRISPDIRGKVVINPRSGVVVIGKDVRMAEVAVSYKGAEVQIGQRTRRNSEEGKKVFLLPGYADVRDLVSLLQDLGLEVGMIIEILKAVEEAGALFGTLQIM